MLAFDLVLFGVPGAGKTTFVEHLQRTQPLRYVSLGNIVRARMDIEHDDYLRKLLQDGGQWPIGVVQELLNPYLSGPSPIVIDGVPKYTNEATWLDEVLSARETPTALVMLDAPSEQVADRLANRSPGQRPETLQHFRERTQAYRENLPNLLDVMKTPGRPLVYLDTGSLTPEAAGIQLLNLLQNSEESLDRLP